MLSEQLSFYLVAVLVPSGISYFWVSQAREGSRQSAGISAAGVTPTPCKLIGLSQSVTKCFQITKNLLLCFHFQECVVILFTYWYVTYFQVFKSHCSFGKFAKVDVLLALRRSLICVIAGIRSVFLVFPINYRIVYLGIAFQWTSTLDV